VESSAFAAAPCDAPSAAGALTSPSCRPTHFHGVAKLEKKRTAGLLAAPSHWLADGAGLVQKKWQS
jgi:hypothetical protein